MDIEDSSQFIEMLKQRINDIDKSNLIELSIGGFVWKQCPACLSNLSHKEKCNDTDCTLCGSDLKGSEKRLDKHKLLHELETQLNESLKLQRKRNESLVSLSAEAKRIKLNLNSKSKAYATLRGSSITQNDVKYSLLQREIGELVSIASLKDKKELYSQVATMENQVVELTAKIEGLDEQIREEGSNNKVIVDGNMKIVGEKLKNFLVGENMSDKDENFKTINELEINFEKNRYSVNGRYNYSASTMAFIKSGIHASLLFASCSSSSMNHPRFLIMDSLEDKGMEDYTIHDFQTKLLNISDSSSVEHQIILTATTLSSEVEARDLTVGGYYSNGRKTLEF